MKNKICLDVLFKTDAHGDTETRSFSLYDLIPFKNQG